MSEGRVELDRDTVERDLMRLVLTVVELLRQLMERQALRRVDQGDLMAGQEERIGLTLMLLGERMEELCERYGVEPEELNIDMGPLGPLLPTAAPTVSGECHRRVRTSGHASRPEGAPVERGSTG
jgi:hypothetical protein